MVGVGPERVGGMWTVADQYMKSDYYNKKVNLTYVATSTNGSKLKRLTFMLKGLMKIQYKLKHDEYDIVHIHMAEKGSTFRKGIVVKMAAKCGCKVIVHLHAGPFMTWYNSLENQKQLKIKNIFANIDRLLVLGEYWKKEMKQLIPEEKITVLYNGAEIPNINSYNINSYKIIYSGVMKKEKGIYDLIDAIKMIDDRIDKKYKVELYGNDLEGNIDNYMKDNNISHRFILKGWVDSDKKDSIYNHALINVLPSYYEGLSMSVIEAMSYGIPTITTNISTMPELLGETVVLVKPGDVHGLAKEIKRYCENPELLKKLSQLLYERSKKIYNIDNNIKNLIQIYKNLLID